MNYVISLKRTPERLKNFKLINDHMKFEVFDAIDGEKLTPAHGYPKNALGNAKSHFELWKKCASGTDSYLICEDDAEIHRNFESMIQKFPKNYDFICFGWNFDADLWISTEPFLSPVKMSFDQDSMRLNKKSYLENSFICNLFKLHLFNGTFCYLISPFGASKFLEICFPLKQNINLQITSSYIVNLTPTALDMAMSEAYQETNSYVCFPPIAISENNHLISTVQNS